MKTLRPFAFIFAIVICTTLPALAAGGFRLIAHPGVHTTSLTKVAVSAIFLKKTPKWEDGTPVVAVDQTEQSAVRSLFSSSVHGKSVAAVKSFWQQQIFSGRDVPPVEKRSDAEVLEFVRSTPGAVGYVADGAPVSGVTVIDVR
jgi:ABC-type phosphate transport system substrate-binding protein